MPDWLDDMSAEERTRWDEMVEHFRRDTLQKMDGSAFVASLVLGEFDVKFALETGAAVMLDKPIIAIVMPGAHMSKKMALISDEIVEADIDTEAGREAVAAAIARMGERFAEEADA